MGWTDLGSLASYLVFVRQTTMPINQFTQQGNFLLAALAGAERIFAAMDEDAEVDEGTVDLVAVQDVPAGRLEKAPGEEPAGRWAWCDRSRPDVPAVPLRGDVRFHNVDFGYVRDHLILQGFRCTPSRGRRSPSWAPPARARPPSPTLSTASMM